LFPKTPQQQSASRRNASAARRALAKFHLTRICLLLCVSISCAQTSRAAGRQQPAQAPTPNIRPRTVGAKVNAPTPDATPNKATSQQTGREGSEQSQEVDDEEVVRVNSNLVIIPASVVDANGRAITDLKTDDFELKVDGEVKAIGDLSRAETPVHIALLFDNSASLSAAREFEKQAAVRFFQSVVRPIDRAAVYSISTNSTLAQGLTNDVPRLVRTIQNFGKPDGATALFDAVTQASDYVRPLQGRKVLVIVSDGTDTVSDASFDDAVNRALRAECQVYVVQTHQVEDPNLHDTVSEQRMRKLTEQTGGAVFVPQSVNDLDSVFAQISLDISQQYLLSYYPQDERKDNFFRFISLRVKTRSNTRVRARKGFYPSSAQVPTNADGAQFTGGLSNSARPAGIAGNSVNAAPTDIASQKRADANARSSNARRDDGGAGRKIGPDGPDEDRPKQAASGSDSSPTFTLTTLASVTTQNETASLKDKEAATTEPAVTPTPTPTPMQAPTEVASQPKSPTQPAPSPTNEQTTPKASDETKTHDPISGGVLNSKALSLPPPAYPLAARNAGIFGKVVVEVLIDEHGKVLQARALSGHPWLQQSAVSAAKLARFTPTLLNGQPVPVKGTINYDFMRP
jgi:Ca-activated chloride channel family protein